jgi:hypothetical protein
MAGFTKVSGPDIASKKRTIGAVAYAVGDLLMASRSAGTLVAATSSATVSLLQGGGIVTKATDGVVTEVEVQPISFDAVYAVESANASNSAHRYMRVALSDANTVNNGGSDDGTNGVVQQVGEVGATSNQVILVEFLRALT